MLTHPRRSWGGALALAVALPLLATGTANADPEPGTPPPAQADAFLAREAAAVQRAEALIDAGAVGVGIAANGSLVAMYPKGASALTTRSAGAQGAVAATAVLDRAGIDRFDKVMKSRSWRSDAAKYAYGYYIDAATGRMVVETAAPAAVTKALAAQFPGAVDVRTSVAAGRLSRQNDSAPHWGGAAITDGSGVCTSGFTVKNSAGTEFMVTAGHCFGSGASVRSTGGGQSFGKVVNRASFPTWDLELLGGSTYGTHIYTGNATGTGTHVVSAANPAVGSTYCVSGQTTATTCNHTVSSLTASFCDSAGCTPGLIAASGGGSVGPGDSGAPFYYQSGSSVYIRGVTIAKSGSTMYAEKWSTVAGHFGVTINS